MGVDEEQPALNPREQLVKEKSLTMEYFLESRNLDKVTEEMLKKYDKDGDGAFSKDEVVSIIIDLRQEHEDNDKLSATNRLYKRLLATAVALCVFLLAGMFALSYAVAALTAKTDVMADGTMVAIGTTDAVATDSRAEVHPANSDENGVICVTRDEAELMLMEVSTGRNVLLDVTNPDGSENLMQLNGIGAFTVGESSFCFIRPSDRSFLCYSPNIICHSGNSAGRRLSEQERRELEAMHGRRFDPRRRLQGNEGAILPSTSFDHFCVKNNGDVKCGDGICDPLGTDTTLTSCGGGTTCLPDTDLVCSR